MEEGIYYKRGSKSDFIGVDVLPNGRDILRVVIKNIIFHDTLKVNGRVEKDMWTAEFEQNQYFTKPMILNATCRKRIAKLFWNEKVEDGSMCEGRINLLHGVAVRLTKEKCRDVADGGETEGLRISKLPADPAPTAQKKEIAPDKANVVIYWAKTNGKTIEDIKAAGYVMTKEVEEMICKALEG